MGSDALSEYPSLDLFIRVLTHECVHGLNHFGSESKAHHGRDFFDFAEHLEEHGIPLSKSIPEELNESWPGKLLSCLS